MNHVSLATEILAAITGLLGAWFVADDDGKAAGWGFVAFLASNAAWIAVGYMSGLWGLIAQQVGFTALSLRGIWKKLLRDVWTDLSYFYRSGRMSGCGRREALRRAIKDARTFS